MTVLPFSKALQERTWSGHSDSEGAGFMTDLMKGDGTRDDYIALSVQHYFIYEAIEGAEAAFAGNETVARFATPRLTRLPALEADLEFLIGADWREQITPLPTTVEYVNRLAEIVEEGWAGGFVAHHYTRYMGDLSGGQFIKKVMQRRFEFETNGVGFYIFDEIADPAEFKNHYRTQLDEAGWDEAESERVIDEVLYAYRLNTALFVDLAAAKAAAAA